MPQIKLFNDLMDQTTRHRIPNRYTIFIMIFFSTAQTEKNSRKKLGKTRFIVWWFDPMSSLIEFVFIKQIK